MTQDSINNYNAKRADAQSAINLANSIIDNGDATAQQIADENLKLIKHCKHLMMLSNI